MKQRTGKSENETARNYLLSRFSDVLELLLKEYGYILLLCVYIRLYVCKYISEQVLA